MPDMFVGFSSDVILEDTLKVTSCHILLAFNSVFHIISDKLEAWKIIHFFFFFFISILPFLSVFYYTFHYASVKHVWETLGGSVGIHSTVEHMASAPS